MKLESGDCLYVDVANRCLHVTARSLMEGCGEAAFTPEEAMSWLEELAGRSRENRGYLPLAAGGVRVTMTRFEARTLVKCVENQAHKLFFR